MPNNNASIRAVLAAVFLMAGSHGATSAQAAPAFMPTAGTTTQPIGHYDFCRRHRAECEIRSASHKRVRLTPAAWNELVDINALVNSRNRQTTDIALFGRPEVWTYPHGAGDCEDLALQKRRLLMERGWPVGALLITVVRQPDGAGHAVLTVLTDRGDLVLDNLETRVLVWTDTELHFVKRQSEFHTGRWTAINDDRTITAVGTSSR